MVTSIPFYSGKSFTLGHSVPFWVMLVLVAVFVFVSSDPPVVLFGLFVIYGVSGWFIWLWRWQRARKLSRLRQEGPEPSPAPPDANQAGKRAEPFSVGPRDDA
jgi:CDP-diacylglycerol--serine O-phosphatidyltransferase